MIRIFACFFYLPFITLYQYVSELTILYSKVNKRVAEIEEKYLKFSSQFRKKYCVFFEYFFTVDISIINDLSWSKNQVPSIKGSEDRICPFSFFVSHSSILILFVRITISIGSNGLSLYPYDKFAIPLTFNG